MIEQGTQSSINVKSELKQNYSDIHRHKVGFTNKIFQIKEQEKTIFFVPSYLRLKMKNIVALDFDMLGASINCAIILSISYNGLPNFLVEKLYNSIQLAFSQGQLLKLEKGIDIDIKDQQKHKTLRFTIRRIITARLKGQIFWSPFQIIRIVVTIVVNSFKFKIEKQQYQIKFNLMDNKCNQLKLSASEKKDFGYYNLAQGIFESQFSNQLAYSKSITRKRQSLCQKHKVSPKYETENANSLDSHKGMLQEIQSKPLLLSSNKIKNFQYGHFVMPVYKQPMTATLSIYLPLLLLGAINIGVFFQDSSGLSDKMINIVALMVSFIALIPTIRAQTIISSDMNITEMLVYLQALTTLVSMFHMIHVKDDSTFSNTLVWYKDVYILACVSVTGFVFAIIILLTFFHFVKWKPKYIKRQKTEKKISFDPKQWRNSNCDKYFADLDPDGKFYQFPQLKVAWENLL